MVKCGDGFGLVDVGLATYEAALALLRGLKAIGIKPQEVAKVFLTHFHADHITLAQFLAEVASPDFYIGAEELGWAAPSFDELAKMYAEEYKRHGAPPEVYEAYLKLHPMAYFPGLEGVVVKETEICHIDLENSKIYYRGYDLEELAERSTFEETAYLLLYGKLPTRGGLEQFKAVLRGNRAPPQHVTAVLQHLPKSAEPIDVLRTGVSAMEINAPALGGHTPIALAN